MSPHSYGAAFKGTLFDVGAYDLAIHAISHAVDRAGIEPQLYDDVIMGESRYGGGDMLASPRRRPD